jgi:hypothetical protein
VSLREQAAIDARAILEDSAGGFGQTITVTDPDGASADLTGFWTDVAHVIDPETGVGVSGRAASVALPIAALTAAGLGIPRGIADTGIKPWRVSFEDLEGNSHTFKVSEGMPDRALNVVVCTLEAYR